MSDAEIHAWVRRANQVWNDARLAFEVSGRPDHLNSTVLNGMMGEAGENWEQARVKANYFAARYPGRLVVFFRHGPDPEPTGLSFSWTDVNFVVMGGFRGNRVCGRDNLDLLAHEIGHYFGLAHPFNRSFRSREEAEAHFLAKGRIPDLFDNDGLLDTPPTPYVRAFQCGPEPSFQLAGQSFSIPRDNVMSYYYRPDAGAPPRELSPGQIARARRVAELRIRGGGPLPVNSGVEGGIEFESLTVVEADGVHATLPRQEQASAWSGGSYLFCRAVNGGRLTFRLPVDKPGRHRLEVYGALGPDFGNLRLTIDDRPVGTELRGWAPLQTPSGRAVVAYVKLAAGGHLLRFEVRGKERASKGYNFGLDCIRLEPE